MIETWSLRTRLGYIILVPRPFPPPVFDHLQYAKTEGGRPGRVTCMTSGRCESRLERGGPCSIVKVCVDQP